MTGSPSISQYGLAAALPGGWDAAIYRRAATAGEATHPILHAASFALPVERGDFGSGAVEAMGPGDVFVALLEYGRDSAGTALFARKGLPGPLTMRDFSPKSLQRMLPGQAGVQRFFAVGGRAFQLYVVLGSYSNAPSLVPLANQVIAGLAIQSPSGTP